MLAMKSRTLFWPLLFTWFILLALAACGGAAEPAAAPRATRAPAATATPRPTPTVTAVTVFDGGRNDNGTFYRGQADAPVTVIDYGDFL